MVRDATRSNQTCRLLQEGVQQRLGLIVRQSDFGFGGMLGQTPLKNGLQEPVDDLHVRF